MLVLALEFSRGASARSRVRRHHCTKNRCARGERPPRPTIGLEAASPKKERPLGHSLKTEERKSVGATVLDPMTDGLPARPSSKGARGAPFRECLSGVGAVRQRR
jgi:hypothetical protein